MSKADRSIALSTAQVFASAFLTCAFIAFPWMDARAESLRWICVALGSTLLVVSAMRIRVEFSRRRAVRDIIKGVDTIVAGNYSMRFLARDDTAFGELLLAINRLVEILESDRARSIRSERARKSLLSDISHDIRTPLTSIIGYIGALRDDIAADAAERDSYLEIIDAKSRSLKAMIDDIFQLAKLDADDIPMHPETIDLCELSREVLIGFLPDFARQSVELVADIPEREVFARADRISVERIVRNLVQNALSHGGDGKMVRVSVRHGKNGAASLSVADRGKGIPPEDIPRVFDRLYRRDSARGTSSGGSGLGLAIVQSLAEKNGASVCVTSEVGLETEFSVSFPQM